MIKTTRQLKDKMNNLSRGNSKIAQSLYRNYFMERFLERLSLSKYKNNFILKGGMLVSSILGITSRATMDIDTSVISLDLNKENILNVINEIINIKLEDNVTFEITNISNIMEENIYPGVRIKFMCHFGTFNQMIKLDISTGDVMTPSSINYKYKLMLEDRNISLLSYNLETLLAEKLETIISRGLANTRMRDFYDVYEIFSTRNIDFIDLKEAFRNTSIKRNTNISVDNIKIIINEIKNNEALIEQWNKYEKDNYFINDVTWNEIMKVIEDIFFNSLNF